MIVDIAIVIFFKLLNFAVLISIFIYLWHRYGNELVMTEFEKGKAYLASLINGSNLLRQEIKKLKKGYSTDEKERLKLKEHLFVWQDSIKKEEQALNAFKQQRVKMLQEQTKRQLQRVQEYRLYRQIQKEAIEQVRDQMQKQYSSSDAQTKIIKTIVNRLDVG